MKLAKYHLNISFICLFSIGILSCSSSKMIVQEPSTSDKENIAKLKSGLKFKTHFGLEGETDIKATNISENSIDLSDLIIYIEQLGTGNYKSYTLQELEISDYLRSKDAMDLHLSLDERIENDFGGQEDNYNVSIVYKSSTPLNNGDESNIYYISYKYTGK